MLRRLICALFLTVAALLPSPTALAQGQTRISLSPVTFELNANPGDSLTNKIKVTNLTDSPLQLETKVENIAGTGDIGQVRLTTEESHYSLSSWVKTEPSRFDLLPKENRFVTFTITIPANAEPGGHYGSLLVGTIGSDIPNQTGASVVQRLGSLLLVKVSGTIDESAKIIGVRAGRYFGSWDELLTTDGKTKILTAKDQLPSGKTTNYISAGPTAFELSVKNEGTVHIKPQGSVGIYNLINKKVAELPIDGRNIFPGTDRKITVIWPQKRLLGGLYHARFSAVYGEPNQSLTAELSFWAFPLPVLIAVASLVTIALLLRRRLGRAFRIIIKGG